MSESLEDVLFEADYNHAKEKTMGRQGILDNVREDGDKLGRGRGRGGQPMPVL